MISAYLYAYKSIRYFIQVMNASIQLLLHQYI